ncbi:hypothetical protein Tco_0566320 [Tanacetum coccineum]
MTSFDYRLNPIYAIKECSSCGSLYTSNCGCSKGSLEDKILVPKPPRNCARCARCGTPVDGPYCQGCALLRKEFMEGLFTNCVENEFFEDLQDTSESSNDNTNVVNAPREPIVVDQDPVIQRGRRKSESRKSKRLKIDLEDSICYDDEKTHTIAYHTRVSPIVEIPLTSLSMGDGASDTISETDSDEFIKSCVEDLVPIPSVSEGIPDSMCDISSCDRSDFNIEAVADELAHIILHQSMIVSALRIEAEAGAILLRLW